MATNVTNKVGTVTTAVPAPHVGGLIGGPGEGAVVDSVAPANLGVKNAGGLTASTRSTARSVDKLFYPYDENVVSGQTLSKANVQSGDGTKLIYGFIPVIPGRTYTFGAGALQAQTVTGFFAGTNVSAAGSDVAVASWVCPTGVDTVRVTILLAQLLNFNMST